MPTLRWLAIVFLAITGTVAAQAAPAPPAPAPAAPAAAPTPEQAIAARRLTIRNGDYRSIHYSVDGLNLIEAVAYRRLEFLENEAERNGDLQNLDRLRIQNATQAERLVVPTLSIYSRGGRNFRRYSYYPAQSGYCDSGSPATQMLQTLDDLTRAYLDVLNVERARQGLPPRVPLPMRAAAAAPAVATPAAPTPVVATPAAPTQTTPIRRSPVAMQETNSNDALVRQVKAFQADVNTRLATMLTVRNALGVGAGDLVGAPPARARPLPTPADVTPTSKDSSTFAGEVILPLAAAGCLVFFLVRRRPGLGVEA